MVWVRRMFWGVAAIGAGLMSLDQWRALAAGIDMAPNPFLGAILAALCLVWLIAAARGTPVWAGAE